MPKENLRLILFVVTVCFFITGFVFNITSDQSLYNENLNLVPLWQLQEGISSAAFIAFMNLVSVLMDTPVCAGYIALLWLLSARRL